MEGFDPRTSFGYEESKRYDAVDTRGDEEQTVAFLSHPSWRPTAMGSRMKQTPRKNAGALPPRCPGKDARLASGATGGRPGRRSGSAVVGGAPHELHIGAPFCLPGGPDGEAATADSG
jgi:hypothetical protein